MTKDKEIEELHREIGVLRFKLRAKNLGLNTMIKSTLIGCICCLLYLITALTPLNLIHPVLSILGIICSIFFLCLLPVAEDFG